MPWTSLCDLEELEEGRGKYVEIGGFRMAVYLHDGQVFVMDDACPHAGASLSAGHVADGCAVCPRHAWAFHLDNGQLRGAPGVTIDTYRSRIIQPPGEGRPKLVQADLPIF